MNLKVEFTPQPSINEIAHLIREDLKGRDYPMGSLTMHELALIILRLSPGYLITNVGLGTIKEKLLNL